MQFAHNPRRAGGVFKNYLLNDTKLLVDGEVMDLDEDAYRMKSGVLYIIGPGSSTSHIMKDLDLPGTLLGVDLVADKKLLAADVNEAQVWEALQNYDEAHIIATVIGGQGHLFGRGNQQLSPRIIKKVGKDNIHIIASKQKLADLYPNPFLVDTGDAELDESLCGYVRVPQSRTQDVTFKIDR